MVPAAAQVGARLAAAVGHHPARGVPGADPDAIGPVRRAVAAAALELTGDGQRQRLFPGCVRRFSAGRLLGSFPRVSAG